MELKYFSPEEFQRCNPPCDMSQMSEKLLHMLNEAREIYGKPIVINSAYRDREYEITRGRSGKSSHCTGHAVDIRCVNSRDRLVLIYALLSAGFKRIGIAKTFVHADNDPDKSPAVWLY